MLSIRATFVDLSQKKTPKCHRPLRAAADAAAPTAKAGGHGGFDPPGNEQLVPKNGGFPRPEISKLPRGETFSGAKWLFVSGRVFLGPYRRPALVNR